MTHTKTHQNRHFGQTVDDDIIFSKGVYPYSFMDHVDKLDARTVPTKVEFYDILTDSNPITDKDYDHAQRAWQQFNCQTMRDYTLRYLELDVTLLADVFENFRRLNLLDCDLDPANFITLPQLSFAQAFLNRSVDLLHEKEMYAFFEEGIRGGMTFVNRHETTAANNYIPDGVTQNEQQTYLAYWDANNLYGNALMQKLPCRGFRWLSEWEWDAINWLTVDTEGDIGYCLKVDLEYPTEIHARTNDYPLAPENATITWEMYTPFMRDMWTRRCELRDQIPKYLPERKLLLTCTDKEEYVVHFKVLQFYLQMGMRITKVHAAVAFEQAAIFHAYIQGNSTKRTLATNDFEKDLYKLKNNSLFGKTMENVRGRKDFKLVNTAAKMLEETRKAQFIDLKRFDEQLVMIELLKMEVKLNKPIYIGQAVLDLSKLIMYQLRYQQLDAYATQLNGRIEVLGGDTDSLICKIVNIDLYSELHPRMLADGLLDSSNYPRTHALFSTQFKAQLGCIKDEVAGQVIKQAILLKPKCYSLQTVTGAEKKQRAKGVQRCVRQRLSHDDYVRTYEQQLEVQRNMRRFQSSKHVIYTVEQSKWALSALDNKRAWIDGNTSFAFGHVELQSDIRNCSQAQYRRRRYEAVVEHVLAAKQQRMESDNDSSSSSSSEEE